MDQEKLALLREAIAKLETEIEKVTLEFESRLAPLTQQLADYRTAEKVWANFLKPAIPRIRPGIVVKLPASKKPDNIPTVPDMIIKVLEDVQANLLEDGITPEAILAEIRRRWWPEARSNDVGPIAWRMAVKEGRLEKIGSLYSLPTKQKEAAE